MDSVKSLGLSVNIQTDLKHLVLARMPLVLSEFRLVYHQYQVLSHSSVRRVLFQIHHTIYLSHTMFLHKSVQFATAEMQYDNITFTTKYRYGNSLVTTTQRCLIPQMRFRPANYTDDARLSKIYEIHICSKNVRIYLSNDKLFSTYPNMYKCTDINDLITAVTMTVH